MPSVRITNLTPSTLNISLKHICALHFENEVQPGQTIKLCTGKVWFTLEAIVDNKDNRYSAARSAATIAIITVAACAAAAAASAPLLTAAAGTTVGGAAAAAGSTIAAGFATATAAASSFLATHAGTAAKISSVVLPKALEQLQNEFGGDMTQVQKEVVSIISSPTVSEDIRKSGLSILRRIAEAHKADQKAEQENGEASSSIPAVLEPITDAIDKKAKKPTRPALERSASSRMSSATSILKKVTEAREQKKARKEEEQVASWEVVDAEPEMLSDKAVLRVHGIYVGERRQFEIREKNGRLELFDVNKQALVS